MFLILHEKCVSALTPCVKALRTCVPCVPYRSGHGTRGVEDKNGESSSGQQRSINH